MTVEGRLARGKANHDAGKFLSNSETLEYVASMNTPKAAPKEVPKEAKKDAPSAK